MKRSIGLADRHSVPIYCTNGPAHTQPCDTCQPEAADESFDYAAWVAIIEHQRSIIANAAGVHPSKVRIQVGH